MTLFKLLAGIVAGGAAGAAIGNKAMPNPIIDLDVIPFLPNKAMAAQYYNKYPGAMFGALVGGVIGAIISTRFMKKSASLAQAQPVNSGEVQVAITWANGNIETVNSNENVPGEQLMPYLTDGILDIAEAQFGQNAIQMFPATIDVIHGDQFYRGMMTIDQDGLPDMILENTSVKRPEYLAKGADRRNAKREQAAKSAINSMNAGRVRVQPGEIHPNDFMMPIPTRRG